MARPIAALTAMAFCALPGFADEPAVPVATWAANNGTLPPAYRRSLRAEIDSAGWVTMRSCQGYDETGPACRISAGEAPEGAVAAILAAAVAAEIFARPPVSDAMVPVGGGSVHGSVTLDGETVMLPAFPVEEDRRRVADVLHAIATAIPPGGQAQPADADLP
ncbi:MAG: hypothetical protein KF887_19415 [Paracoccaceae bacterium]|nr:MAG: hypothetical protein KF887_19415 [Paracoccaceae bacterium]